MKDEKLKMIYIKNETEIWQFNLANFIYFQTQIDIRKRIDSSFFILIIFLVFLFLNSNNLDSKLLEFKNKMSKFIIPIKIISLL